MTIEKITELKYFPTERTIFYLLEDKPTRKQRIEKEIKSWKTKFPSAKSEIEITELISSMISNINTADDAFLVHFKKYNEETKILKGVKSDSKKKIEELLTIQETDIPVVKLLKEVAQEQKTSLELKIGNWNIGVIGIAFLIDSVEGFYLKELPTQIQSELDIAEPVKLEELDQDKLKEHIGNIYTDLYTEFTDNKQRKDFDKFQEEINKELEGLKTLIDGKRKEKTPEKPKENIEDIKKELEATKARLKIYDDAFGSLYPPNQFPNDKTEDLVNKWWTSLNAEWKSNFTDKYGVIYSDNLKKVKKDLDDREQWLTTFPPKDYPKGAEDVKKQLETIKTELGQWKGFCTDYILGLTQQEEVVEEKEEIKNEA